MVCQNWIVVGLVLGLVTSGASVSWAGSLELAPVPVEDQSPKSPSISRAVFLSLVLPGMGHRVSGAQTGAKVFMAAELGIWLAYFGFKVSGNRTRDDAVLYAAHHADANSANSDEDYQNAVEDFVNADEYNDQVRQEARDRYPNDLEGQLRYIDENSYSGVDNWFWDSSESWGTFRDLRNDSRRMKQYAVYCTGAALLNRVVAAIDAARVAHRGRSVPAGVVFLPHPDGTGMQVVVTISF